MSSRYSKRSRTILAALAACAAPPCAAQGATADGIAYPADALVLFVAGWCAPCRAEVARLDAIADAARPLAVRVVLIDDSAAGRAMMTGVAPQRRWQPEPGPLRRLRTAVFADSAGLPYSIVTDRDGVPCADRRDGLDAARTRMLVARCAPRR